MSKHKIGVFKSPNPLLLALKTLFEKRRKKSKVILFQGIECRKLFDETIKRYCNEKKD